MLRDVWSLVFETGFFASDPVRTALVLGAIVSVISALVGTFTVIRGQSFAGHSLADIGTAGGSAAYLVSVPTLAGYVAFNMVAAGVMELIGIRRPRGRDLATGIVLGAALGLAALFLYLDVNGSTTTGSVNTVLFGSIFIVDSSTLPDVLVLGAIVLIVLAILYRPLLLTSVSYDLAAVRGVRVRLVGIGYLLTLALAVSMAAVTIGAILSTALLIGPAAASLRLTARTGRALIVAALLGLFATWLGILLSYDTAAWSPQGQGWPASFCIVAMIFVVYIASTIPGRLSTIRGRRRPRQALEAR